VIEAYLERIATLLGNADDQHLVIMAHDASSGAASSAAVYIALDCRTDLGYQILGLAIH
jgi:hypothetical protein